MVDTICGTILKDKKVTTNGTRNEFNKFIASFAGNTVNAEESAKFLSTIVKRESLSEKQQKALDAISIKGEMASYKYAWKVLHAMGWGTMVKGRVAKGASQKDIAAFCDKNATGWVPSKKSKAGVFERYDVLSEKTFNTFFNCVPCTTCDTPVVPEKPPVVTVDEEPVTPGKPPVVTVDEEPEVPVTPEKPPVVTVDEEPEVPVTPEVTVEEEDCPPVVNGKDGTNGTNGIDGKDGTNGTNGIDGKNGTNGIDGKDGKNGKKGSIWPGVLAGIGAGLAGGALFGWLFSRGKNKNDCSFGSYNTSGGGYCPPTWGGGGGGYDCYGGYGGGGYGGGGYGGGYGGNYNGGLCLPYDGYQTGGAAGYFQGYGNGAYGNVGGYGDYGNNGNNPGRIVVPSVSPTYGYLGPENYVGAFPTRTTSSGNTYLKDVYETRGGTVAFNGIQGVGVKTSPTTIRA